MTEPWLLVALVALATHRVTRLIVTDRILRRPREWAQEWFEDRRLRRRGGPAHPEEWQSPVAYLLSCPWCMSIWVGGVIVAATALTVGLPVPLLVWAAASSVAGLLAQLEDRERVVVSQQFEGANRD